MITNAILQQMTGAVSFRRWLGCAPTIVARAPTPPPPLKRPRHRFLNNRRRANGPFRTTLGSSPGEELEEHSPRPSLHRGCDAWSNDARIHRWTPAPAAYETLIREAHRRTRTHPSDAAAGWDADQMGFSTKRRGSWLACAA